MHTTLEEETLARLDDHEQLRPAEKMQAGFEREQAQAVMPRALVQSMTSTSSPRNEM